VKAMTPNREAVLSLIIVAIVVIVIVRAPEFLIASNISNILSGWGFLAILVMGQLCVLVTRGIDLSQASVLAFTGMFLALLSQSMPGLPAAAFLVLATLMGLCLGLVNGALVSIVGIPPIIATLGTMTIIRGLIFVLSDGAWISSHEMSDAFKAFPAGAFIGVPQVFWVALVVIAVFWVLLNYRRIGRDIYAFGSNPHAARNAGVPRIRIELLVYALSGAAAGLCGYLWAGRFAIAYTQAAEGREFAIIAACVIGGISITGGRGSVLGAALGALFIAIVESALPYLRISPFLQTAVIGAVILFAVAANARSERRPGRQILPRHKQTTGEVK